MPSSRQAGLRAFAAILAATAFAPDVRAQPAAQGFAVERLYQSAPGAGWFVMDALDMRGGLGGVFAVTSGYASNPLRVSDGARTLGIVSDEAFVDFGFAATYDRLRLYLDLAAPLDSSGQSGTLGGLVFTAPSASLAHTPDTLFDTRFGLDARILGGPQSPFRLGASAQLFVPIDVRADYDTDATYRGMLRALVAGDLGRWSYAGQLGVHIRPLDDASTPGSPQGSELLFGIALGGRAGLGAGRDLVVGPEVFGETALRSLFGGTTTGVEGLMTARVEGTADDGLQLRVKLGAGGGLDAQFGAPEWRAVVGVELFDRGSDRDGDGVGDSKDACPDRPGPRTADPRTNGCPEVPPL
jgi:hypothetical protein